MNPRLAALLRQRDLLREHATWLDGEIAREQGSAVAPPSITASTATDAQPAPVVPATSPSVVPEPDIKGLHHEVRQGCMLYFLIAAGLLGGLIGFIYWRY